MKKLKVGDILDMSHAGITHRFKILDLDPTNFWGDGQILYQYWVKDDGVGDALPYPVDGWKKVETWHGEIESINEGLEKGRYSIYVPMEPKKQIKRLWQE